MMAKKNNEKQPKDQTIERHFEEKSTDKYKTKGKGIPGRETY